MKSSYLLLRIPTSYISLYIIFVFFIVPIILIHNSSSIKIALPILQMINVVSLGFWLYSVIALKEKSIKGTDMLKLTKEKKLVLSWMVIGSFCALFMLQYDNKFFSIIIFVLSMIYALLYPYVAYNTAKVIDTLISRNKHQIQDHVLAYTILLLVFPIGVPILHKKIYSYYSNHAL